MQLGFYAEGEVKSVLDSLVSQVKEQKVKFATLCKDNQVHIGYANGGKALHRAVPIKDTTSAELLDLALTHAREQLAHLGPEDECSVSFNITVHRSNPT